MVEYCHNRNVPFCENEKRYYDLMKNKQNFRNWVENWKRYCNINIIDLPEKPKADFKPESNNFLRALMAMAKRAKEQQEKEEKEK